MTHLSKEETAAHVLALIQAKFERPDRCDVEDIMDRARQQAQQAFPVFRVDGGQPER
jgi:hypothetical protein